jgi:hypothetical protein
MVVLRSQSVEQMERQGPIAYHAGPTLHLLSRLVRALIEEKKSFHWKPNDGLDFAHAIVPLVYADAMFLDKHWKNRVERLKLNGSFAKVFYGYEAETFLDWFEKFDEPGH